MLKDAGVDVFSRVVKNGNNKYSIMGRLKSGIQTSDVKKEILAGLNFIKPSDKLSEKYKLMTLTQQSTTQQSTAHSLVNAISKVVDKLV